MKIDIPKDLWQANGPADDPHALLIASLEVNGCLMHFEAAAMRRLSDGRYGYADAVPEWIMDAIGASTDWDTPASIRIGRRRYAVIATPGQA